MSGWISCNEKLPDADTEVLVVTEFFGPGDWRYAIGAIDSKNFYNWWVKGGSWTPSHWQPLPKAPIK